MSLVEHFETIEMTEDEYLSIPVHLPAKNFFE